MTFRVGGRIMVPTIAWDNNRLWEVSLRTTYEQNVYLPLIMKDY